MTEPTPPIDRWRMLGQVLRFGIVGVASNIAGYLLYLGITYAGVPPKLTMSMLYAVGTLMGFIGHRKYSFRHTGSLLTSSVRYFAAQLAGWVVSFLILWTFVDRLGYPHQVVQAFSIVLVGGLLFLAFRYVVFPADTRELPE